MTSMSNPGRLVALSLLAFPLGAAAASNALSFTAHSLNSSPGSPALLALDGQGHAYEVTKVTDSSGRSWIRVTKTDTQGAAVATFLFGGTGTDTPSAIPFEVCIGCVRLVTLMVFSSIVSARRYFFRFSAW